MSTLNNTFESVNNEEDPDIAAPTTPLRSGGPESLVSWQSLGHQGRIFIGGRAVGRGAREVQRRHGNRTDPRLRRAELRRRHQGDRRARRRANCSAPAGSNRAVVAVATTTGTGWINEAEASSLEYMYNGNTAIVSMQYSFLPSWLSFLVDKENARQAGQALFEAVDALVREMPEASRPKLVVFGESLGSFGGEAPFLSLNNLIARTDGALFSGPTFNNTIWTDLTANRDAGSPEWLPIYDKGENVRFAADADESRPARRSVGPAAGGVPAARVRSDRVVEPRSAVRQAGLAARAARLRRVAARWSGSRW